MVFHKNDYSYRAVGASGAVTGVLYSAILLQPDMMLGIFFVIPIPAYLFGILYLLYSIYGMKAKNDNIGHTAHFGGAVGGYLITLIKEPQLFVEHTLMVILLAIPILREDELLNGNFYAGSAMIIIVVVANAIYKSKMRERELKRLQP